MNKLRQAKLVSCEKNTDPDPTSWFPFNAHQWIALDSAGRRFVADTKEEAIHMLNTYNHIKDRP